MIKDALGRPIQAGDKVAVVYHSRSSSRIDQDVVMEAKTSSRIYLVNGNYKASHYLIVINDQHKANLEEFPELFI